MSYPCIFNFQPSYDEIYEITPTYSNPPNSLLSISHRKYSTVHIPRQHSTALSYNINELLAHVFSLYFFIDRTRSDLFVSSRKKFATPRRLTSIVPSLESKVNIARIELKWTFFLCFHELKIGMYIRFLIIYYYDSVKSVVTWRFLLCVAHRNSRGSLLTT